MMTPFAFLLGFGTILSMTANYLGRARPRIAVAVITTAINFIVDIILIPVIGIVGGAIGTDVAYTLYAPAHLLDLQAIIGLLDHADCLVLSHALWWHQA